MSKLLIEKNKVNNKSRNNINRACHHNHRIINFSWCKYYDTNW